MKPGVKNSIVWNFFQKNTDGKSVNCKICKRSGNTTNLKCHLERVHPVLLAKTSDRPEEVHQDEPPTATEADVPSCSKRVAADAEDGSVSLK